MPQHGKDTVVLWGDSTTAVNITSTSTNAEIDRTMAMLDSTPFGVNSYTYVAGETDGTITIDTMLDYAIWPTPIMPDGTVTGTNMPMTVSLGTAAGSMAYLIEAIETNVRSSASISDLVRINGVFQAAQDGVDAGALLLPVTTATSTANGATYDRGTSTKTGAVGILHVTATDRADADETMDVVIQHSASSDMSGAATLIAFTTGTTVPVAERVETTTDPLRYIRASYTIAGTTPSFTFAVSFAAR